MKKKYLLIVCVLLVWINGVQSQVVSKVLDQNNQKIKEIAQNVDNAGWVYLKKEKKLVSDDIFVKYKEAFGLTKSDEMVKVKTKTDDLGFKHITYQQYYKGLKVENFTYLVHEKDGIAEIANGELLEDLDIEITPILSPEKSFEIALTNFKSDKWAWQDENWVSEKQDDKGNSTGKPIGELMIISHAIDNKNKGVLVYRFDMLSFEPYFQYAIYINANNGAVEKMNSLSKQASGTVYTLYNGTQNLTTEYRGLPNWDFILKDDTRGYICTKNYSSTSWNWRSHIDNHENLWHNSGAEVEGATAQWAAEKTYDYYHIYQYRHGVDNNNLDLRINRKVGFDNASWEGADQGIHIGYIGSNFLSSLDIMGHEYTHGVIDYEAALVYEKEPGALNESFADIFGTMIEKYAGSTWDWTIGEDVFDNDYLRNMSNPNDRWQPATYLTDNFWVNTVNCTPVEDNDYCGVHTNSGVQNYWFYLLSEGGTFNNITVTGIGTANAARIAYYNMCYYLSSQSGYVQARSASISAAASLFGMCSTEYQQVQNAWAAVGVGDPATPCTLLEVSSIYVSPYPSCGEYCNFSVNASGGNGPISYAWYVNDNLISTYSWMSYYFSEYYSGPYNITLHVTDGNQNVYRYEYYYINCGDNLMASAEGISIFVYPNPLTAEAKVNIIINNKGSDDLVNSDYNISIVDNSGRVLYKTKTKSNELNINLGGYQSGTYSLIITRGKYKGSSLIIKK